MKGLISTFVTISLLTMAVTVNSYYDNCPRGGIHYNENRNEISYAYDTAHMHVVGYDTNNNPIEALCFIFSEMSREVVVCAKCNKELFRSSDVLPTGNKDHRMGR